MKSLNRRSFIQTAALSSLVLSGIPGISSLYSAEKGSGIKMGLCTYLWGKDMDLPALIKACEEARLFGVELRCDHKHGVGFENSPAERKEVKKRFADSPVDLVGFGTNEAFHYQDPEKLKKCIDNTKEWIKLSADCGGKGVKVKPNDIPKGADRGKITHQIADALNEIGRFAADYGQIIRLENHGSCSPIPIMKEIIEQVSAKNVGLCWNCNQDIDDREPGIAENFKSVQKYLADTVHVHELEKSSYPYDILVPLFIAMNYQGWFLLECHTKPSDPAQAMKDLRKEYEARWGIKG
ncbi:MAG: TIM barrel protein [Planctomycetia bacterium]|nr:TIM barrel protein [Planctomycetia bacterium]